MSVKKIMCCCGQGLGSSFMVEMNVQNVLKEMNMDHIEVGHASTSDVYDGMADLYIVGEDLYDSMKQYGEVLTLKNLVSKDEVEEKLKAYFEEKGIE